MSLFRLIKYSSLLYLLGRHRDKLFRSAGILLFALLTSLLYDDLRAYLEIQHPGKLIYALIGKVIIVYGSLLFVLWQFRPGREDRGSARAASVAGGVSGKSAGSVPGKLSRGDAEIDTAGGHLDALTDIDRHDRLRSRYDRILSGESHAPPSRPARTKEP